MAENFYQSQMAAEGLGAFGDFLSHRSASKELALGGKIDQAQAQVIGAYADFESQIQRKQGDKYISAMIGQFAKSGVKFEGSPAMVFVESEKNISLDIALRRLNAANQQIALGFSALQKKIAAGNQKTQAIASLGQGLLKMSGTYAEAKAPTTKVSLEE